MTLTASFEDKLAKLASTPTGLHNKDFLLTWEHSDSEIAALLQVVDLLETMYAQGISTRVFDTGLAVSLFRDQSTRTRFSFASATNMLGLTVQDFDEKKSQIAHGETTRETANMISFMTETIGIRDDMFIHEGHKYMTEFASALEDGFRQGVLAQRPSVVNLQCDLDHPTQSLADLQHLIRTYGGVENLRGKRVAMTWAYSPSYGKPLSVPQGIITLMTRFGMDVVLAHPQGYDVIPETLEVAKRHANASGGRFTKVASMQEAFEGADIVYPKSWAPFHVMEQRTKLLRENRSGDLAALEKECLENNKKFMDWECTWDMMKRTRDGRALYMHCLPADITDVSCEHGEVSADVFDFYRIPTYREASHKPFVIAAMILLTRFADPARVLRNAIERGLPRRLG
ncbi:MAG TPA: knotted carbamoyltransferase YgeW [Polyangiaceae bacterium]|jgi:knotted carbamoyltransferase YgeW|nr:MAG: Ornithine carbamoyltransferase [Deltaproteobacteria bacterium ADurb.Bin207]HNS95850.1 knotted carbamoyltransferase YgeW [Polyangiaceae bacterium]HNZ21489.1 knotted carbamoyltransferase YgeW [Polyangiaceae bacterium]HOD23669.1 knotted carbamoyltransferase YgeW [Polyangiaceae bacterium]HOE50033.1 knotted carbamoyltransferase YgeW [Polyangiaceae bacterium]